MRVVVFGTSNGVLNDGYVKALKARYDVENRSLGASPSMLFAMRRHGLDLTPDDIVILELLTNDIAIRRAGGMDLTMVRAGIVDALDASLASGARVGGLLLPTCTRDRAYTGALMIHRTAFTTRKAPFVDGDSVLSKGDWPSAFADLAHVKPELASEMALELVERLRNTPPPPPRAGGRLTFVPVEGGDVYRNSLMETRVLRSKDLSIRMTVPPDSDVVGVVVNRGDTSCHLRIAGDDTVVKQLCYPRNIGNHIVVTPLRAPVGTRKGLIRLSLTDDAATEGSYKADEGPPDGVIGLCGLIVERRTTTPRTLTLSGVASNAAPSKEETLRMSDQVKVQIVLDGGQNFSVTTDLATADALQTQLQRRMKGDSDARIRFPLSDKTGHLMVIDSSRLLAVVSEPA